MNKCLSEISYESFTLHIQPLNSRRLEKVVSDITKIHVKYFATAIN